MTSLIVRNTFAAPCSTYCDQFKNTVDLDKDFSSIIFNLLSRRQRKTLNALLWLAHKHHRRVFVSQGRLAAMGGGYCREHICRGILPKLEALGLVKARSRGGKSFKIRGRTYRRNFTLQYSFNDKFFQSPYARQLCAVLPAIARYVWLIRRFFEPTKESKKISEKQNVTDISTGCINLYKEVVYTSNFTGRVMQQDDLNQTSETKPMENTKPTVQRSLGPKESTKTEMEVLQERLANAEAFFVGLMADGQKYTQAGNDALATTQMRICQNYQQHIREIKKAIHDVLHGLGRTPFK